MLIKATKEQIEKLKVKVPDVKIIGEKEGEYTVRGCPREPVLKLGMTIVDEENKILAENEEEKKKAELGAQVLESLASYSSALQEQKIQALKKELDKSIEDFKTELGDIQETIESKLEGIKKEFSEYKEELEKVGISEREDLKNLSIVLTEELEGLKTTAENFVTDKKEELDRQIAQQQKYVTENVSAFIDQFAEIKRVLSTVGSSFEAIGTKLKNLK